ncbi:hypothetical protein FHX42_002895 [Saccharopolyspora lacisalsi]|uniref:TrbL/VirB6 plasmid conjugal transfer protein n=1 Tax=Halosaccharopolyspora lacisalsi TaxID=1000566 RepID=A0A839DVM0_9PSEU|nr:hypothetical protein [Halosaccharopolyspora lacisalsi]MBA8825544.1 hypothetical protein [Halosaccharopolyspora lacisalsi]
MTLVLGLAAVFVVLRRRAKSRREYTGAARRRGPLLIVTALLGMQAALGAPAIAQPMNCGEPPVPERPGAGMVGALDPSESGDGQSGSPYDMYGYAGQVWHTYDLGCGPQGMTHPNAMVDTWIGNQLFNVGKTMVAATNGLHYTLADGNILGQLDDVVASGTVALYDSVFAPWFGLVALLLAVVLFRYIWQGDLATIGKRGMWALAALWFASATYLTPLAYTHALDGMLISATSAVQGGFLREVGVDERDALPTLLHNEVVYSNWLRGEFARPDSDEADQLGRELLAAQAWTKSEAAAGEEAPTVDEKQQAFKEVAAKMSEDSYRHLQGLSGSRIGAGTLAMTQGLAYTSFQLLAKAAILLAQLMLRILILAGPLIGLVALLYHEVLRSVGRIAGAAMLNVIVISAMAGIHTLVLNWVFNPTRPFSPLTQILLAGLLTIMFLMIGKPFRRMGQMIELSAGSVGGAMPRVPPGVFSRFRGGRKEQPSSPQDEFWEQVKSSDSEDTTTSRGTGARRRERPESEAPSVVATARRMDNETARRELPSGPPPAGSGTDSAAPSGDASSRQRPGAVRNGGNALPEASSRVVDTSPVSVASWDTHDEDPVLVPSRTGGPAGGGPAGGGPSEPSVPWPARRKDSEVVAGRPVQVLYRPSRGLEVADE